MAKKYPDTYEGNLARVKAAFKRASGCYEAQVTWPSRGSTPTTFRVCKEPVRFKSWAHNRGVDMHGWVVYENGVYRGEAHTTLAAAKTWLARHIVYHGGKV